MDREYTKREIITWHEQEKKQEVNRKLEGLVKEIKLKNPHSKNIPIEYLEQKIKEDK